MIISRTFRGLFRLSFTFKPLIMFKLSTTKPPSFNNSINRFPATENKTTQLNAPDPLFITKTLKLMLHDPQLNHDEQEYFIYKHMTHLTNSDLILLLVYLGSKYRVMSTEKIFVAAAKKIREIKNISLRQFRRLIGMMLRLQWQQEPMSKLYSLMSSKLKIIETEDLCYLVLYGQYIKRINLMTLNQYIKELLAREIKDRKCQFLLYQALHSNHAKQNFNQLLNYKEQLRKFDNSTKNSEYEFVYGKWELVETISKAEDKKQYLQNQLANHQQLTLKQTVILDGIKNKNLINKVKVVFRANLNQIAPLYFNKLLSIVPSQELFIQYILKNKNQLNDEQKLAMLENGYEVGIEKAIVKQQFLKIFANTHQIQKDLFQRMKNLGDKIEIQHIQEHKENET